MENMNITIEQIEQVARTGELFKRLPAKEGEFEGPMRPEWVAYCQLPPSENRRIYAMNAAAREMRKPVFPGWDSVEIPEDAAESASFEYDGDLETYLRKWASRTWREVTAPPEQLVASIEDAYNSEYKAAVAGLVENQIETAGKMPEWGTDD